MGVPSLEELFDEKYYTQLPGGILESFGRLFKNDLKLYVYPLQRSEAEPLQTVQTLEVSPELRPLYQYLAARGSFVDLDNYKAGIPPHLFARRPETHRGRRRKVGANGPAAGGRVDQGARLLRLHAGPGPRRGLIEKETGVFAR